MAFIWAFSMIRRVKFSNFYSFGEEREVDFTVGAKAPDTEAYVPSQFGDRVSKVLVAFGNNASGKTNLIRVFAFLRWLFVESFQFDPDEGLPYFTNFFSDERSNPTHFCVDFEIEDKLYVYDITMSRHSILSESLRLKSANDGKSKYLYRRHFDGNSREFEIEINTKARVFTLPREYRAPYTRRNASLISIGAQVGEEVCVSIRDYWKDSICNVTEATRVHIHTNNILQDIVGLHDEDMESFERTKELLRNFDLGLTDISLRHVQQTSEDGSDESHPILIGMHRSGNVHFQLESDGTRALYIHTARLVEVLEMGSLAALDELDADLHPLHLERLLDLYVSGEVNRRGAQLICTCHTASIMNSLDKYQILLLEKDENDSSQVYRLDQVEGVRADENYYGKYLAGAYGAIPDV